MLRSNAGSRWVEILESVGSKPRINSSSCYFGLCPSSSDEMERGAGACLHVQVAEI